MSGARCLSAFRWTAGRWSTRLSRTDSYSPSNRFGQSILISMGTKSRGLRPRLDPKQMEQLQASFRKGETLRATAERVKCSPGTVRSEEHTSELQSLRHL